METVQRFSNRVENYSRYRPGYPQQIVHVLERQAGLRPGARIADVGCGTGKSAEPFLSAGFTVVGVEPNDAMRAAAAKLLAHWPNFQSLSGTAEQIPLPDASVDAIIAGQAFHWFEPQAARREFLRVLRPGGAIALMWNERRADTTAFLHEYEALLQRYCPEYGRVDHRQFGPERISTFFAPDSVREAVFDNPQSHDWEALRGRLLSSSYVPTSGPNHDRLMEKMRTLFDRSAVAGRVTLEYDTRVYYGALAARPES